MSGAWVRILPLPPKGELHMLRLFKIIELTQVCEEIKEDFSAYSYNSFPYFYYQNQATKTNNI